MILLLLMREAGLPRDSTVAGTLDRVHADGAGSAYRASGLVHRPISDIRAANLDAGKRSPDSCGESTSGVSNQALDFAKQCRCCAICAHALNAPSAFIDHAGKAPKRILGAGDKPAAGD